MPVSPICWGTVLMAKTQGISLKTEEIVAAFDTGEWSERFPPVLNIQQAAELLQLSKATLYDWSSRGRLKHCSRKVGKHLRFWRDRLLHVVFNQE